MCLAASSSTDDSAAYLARLFITFLRLPSRPPSREPSPEASASSGLPPWSSASTLNDARESGSDALIEPPGIVLEEFGWLTGPDSSMEMGDQAFW